MLATSLLGSKGRLQSKAKIYPVLLSSIYAWSVWSVVS